MVILIILGVSVSWNTFKQQTHPCVQYGTSEDKLDKQACSSISETYPTSRTWSNRVTIGGLEPATTYYYQVMSSNSTVSQFMSARLPGDKTPFTMTALADLGVYGENGYTVKAGQKKRAQLPPSVEPSMNHTTIARLIDMLDDYEFVIHPGDLAYADDWAYRTANQNRGPAAYQAILESFYDQLAPVAGRKPYMVSPGNHEAACKEDMHFSRKCPLGQRNFTDFMHRFDDMMPTAFNSTSSNDTARVKANKATLLANPPFWYSFEYGMAHITMLDTETDFPNAPDQVGGFSGLDSGPFGALNQQLEFLEADLASVDRTVTPWLIVAGHRPWYARKKEQGNGARCIPCQQAFESVFYRYGVDLAVFGHVHSSQRFLPMYNSTADAAGMNNPKAPMYIITGGAGSIEGLSNLGDPEPYTEFSNAEVFAFATIRVDDANHLKVDFIQSSSGTVLDSSVLYKEHKERFVIQT